MQAKMVRTANPHSFNLSILECKSETVPCRYYATARFNLSILECKFEWLSTVQLYTPPVLIYPYWNVNKCVWRWQSWPSSFNLSILECKSKRMHRSAATAPGFNLSILECKCCAPALGAKTCRRVLIYPYWNVNEARLIRKQRGAAF